MIAGPLLQAAENAVVQHVEIDRPASEHDRQGDNGERGERGEESGDADEGAQKPASGQDAPRRVAAPRSYRQDAAARRAPWSASFVKMDRRSSPPSLPTFRPPYPVIAPQAYALRNATQKRQASLPVFVPTSVLQPR